HYRCGEHRTAIARSRPGGGDDREASARANSGALGERAAAGFAVSDGAANSDEAAREVIHAASLEVRAPVVYATFVVVLVLAPMLFLSGLQGKFFAPLAASFIFATLASLIVALTVTPALSFLLLRRSLPRSEARWLARLKAFHERILEGWVRGPRTVIAVSVIVMVLAAAALPLFGGQLMPPFREGHFVVQSVAPPGTSLHAMKSLGARVSRDLLEVPGVLSAEMTIR